MEYSKKDMTQSPTPLVIPKRSKICTGTEKPFEPGSEVCSVVFMLSNGDLLRKDYCPSFWFDEGEAVLLKDAFAHWRVKLPDRSKNPLTKHEHAMILLSNLKDIEGKEGLAHLFAQYLLRNKHLAPCFGKNKKEQKNFTYYEVPQTGEVISIQKEIIKKEDLPALEEMLIDLVKEMHSDDEDDEI